jgi:hypothetical protein
VIELPVDHVYVGIEYEGLFVQFSGARGDLRE